MPATPEFIRWAIERPCPLRDHENWQDPERTERQLRALREYSDAVATGRVCDGVCLHADASNDDCESHRPMGFLEDEIGDAYGGHELIRSACSNCPANIHNQASKSSLAGCYGWFESPSPSLRIGGAHIDRTLLNSIRQAFPRTTPTWYGLWINTPLQTHQRELLIQLFEQLQIDQTIQPFVQALRVSVDLNLPIHVTLVPSGHVEGKIWTISAHCSRCKHEMRIDARHCSCCGRTGGPVESRRRNVRGSRPYRPLEEFLDTDRIKSLLKRASGSSQS